MYNELFVFEGDVKIENDLSEGEFFLKRFDLDARFLEKDIYLKYFFRELLIDIDILSVEEFLRAQYLNTSHGLQFLNILNLKVLPKIEDFINGADLLGAEVVYLKPKIDNKFLEAKDGCFYNDYYKNDTIYHHVGYYRLQTDLAERQKIIKSFIDNEKQLLGSSCQEKLIWKIDASIVGYIISELVHNGYIEKPLRGDKINNTALTRQILNSFNFQKTVTNSGLKQYVIRNTTENIRIHEKVHKAGLEIPNAKDLN